jgi:hypothetical protein
MGNNFADETEVIMTSNEDQTEITITLKSKQKLSNEQVIIEVETLAHELSRAEAQLNKPGVQRH